MWHFLLQVPKQFLNVQGQTECPGSHKNTFHYFDQNLSVIFFCQNNADDVTYGGELPQVKKPACTLSIVL